MRKDGRLWLWPLDSQSRVREEEHLRLHQLLRLNYRGVLSAWWFNLYDE